jgi:pseudouridine kinase
MPGDTAPAAFLCIGAAHWDVIGRTRLPLPPGADVPGRITRQPGGVARNVAHALARSGAATALVAAVGRDAPGAALVAGLAAAGVDCRGLLTTGEPTDAYVAIEDAAGALHAAVADCTGLERAGLRLLAPLRDGRLAGPGAPWRGTAVLDGNLPDTIMAALLDGADLAGPLAIVPASPAKSAALAPLLSGRPVTLYLNRREAEAFCGAAFADSLAAAAAVAAHPGVSAIVTDGAGPVTAAAAGEIVRVRPPAVAARSVTGAGDALVAAHLVACAEGCDAAAALERAVATATAHVTREDP